MVGFGEKMAVLGHAEYKFPMQTAGYPFTAFVCVTDLSVC